ncbi:MAG: PHP domain-containing protein [Thermomicrobiales bacterium]
MFDYHVHSEFSVDCAAPMMASCAAAVDAGVTEIAFTDHVDHQHTDPGFGYYRIEEYFAQIDRAREAFDGRLTVLAGVEMDYHPDTADQVRVFVERHGGRYDLVIGSVHYGDDARLIFPDYFDGKGIADVVLPYLDHVE